MIVSELLWFTIKGWVANEYNYYLSTNNDLIRVSLSVEILISYYFLFFFLAKFINVVIYYKLYKGFFSIIIANADILSVMVPYFIIVNSQPASLSFYNLI